jgi:hypothetical protein
MVHWTYIVIAVCLLLLVVQELFSERRWREQIALAMIVVPLLLRILHIK